MNRRFPTFYIAVTLGLVFSFLSSLMQPETSTWWLIIAAATASIGCFSIAIYGLIQRRQNIATISWRGIALLVVTLIGNPLSRIFQVSMVDATVAIIVITLAQIVLSVLALAAIIIAFYREQNRES